MTLKKRAEQLAAQRLADASGSGVFRAAPPGYTAKPEQNLIESVTRGDFWDDLDTGRGSELRDTTRRPAKFCAAYSSSALAVNSFGPFRHHPERLALLGSSSFEEMRFECKCPTGLDGTPPHLDLVLWGNGAVVGVESKFLEPLTAKVAKFADSYGDLVAEESDDAWRVAYDALSSEPRRFGHLDAAQLVKHSLGLRHTFHKAESATLLYLYWEPLGAELHPEFAEHRREISEFADWVAGGDIRFESMAYQDLWSQWEKHPPWEGAAAHVSALRARYAFTL